ncbi:hypothetical protein [Streptomyces sp. NPDC059786]|uniref:hypothetical protein n=1 Tax=Streptomyces sp. NPDC059786 TaxID=3346946 RepID=UPI003652ED71
MKKSGVGRGSLVVGRRSVVVGFAVSAGGAAAGGCTPGTRAAVGGERTTGSASPRPLFFAPDDYREETRKTDRATFTWEDFLTHVGARKKSIPAFDAFDLSTGENNEFGKDRVKARHFTSYSLRHTTTGSGARRLDGDIPDKLRLMNPMHFIERKTPAGRSTGGSAWARRTATPRSRCRATWPPRRPPPGPTSTTACTGTRATARTPTPPTSSPGSPG